jgi:hypothetical protein
MLVGLTRAEGVIFNFKRSKMNVGKLFARTTRSTRSQFELFRALFIVVVVLNSSSYIHLANGQISKAVEFLEQSLPEETQKTIHIDWHPDMNLPS